MNPEDFKSFGVFMSVLQETFSPDKPISKERTKIYFETLKDIPIENIELGIKELMRKKKWSIFPLPVEIREAAGFVEEDDLELSALKAFREACDLVHYFALEKELHQKIHMSMKPFISVSAVGRILRARTRITTLSTGSIL